MEETNNFVDLTIGFRIFLPFSGLIPPNQSVQFIRCAICIFKFHRSKRLLNAVFIEINNIILNVVRPGLRRAMFLHTIYIGNGSIWRK